jgi:hypothetical protein
MNGEIMRKYTRALGVAGVASLLLVSGASPVSAAEVSSEANADATVVATVRVPVDVSSASVSLRPTKVGPVQHPGETVETEPIAADTAVDLVVTVHGGTAADAVVTTTDTADAVDIDDSTDDQGRRCLGLGIDLTAAADASADAELSVSVAVLVGGDEVTGFATGNLRAGADPDAQEFPVQTGADVCLPVASAGAEGDVMTQVDAAADAVAAL